MHLQYLVIDDYNLVSSSNNLEKSQKKIWDLWNSWLWLIIMHQQISHKVKEFQKSQREVILKRPIKQIIGTSLESVFSGFEARPNRWALTIFLTLSDMGTPNFSALSLALSSVERVPNLTTFFSSTFSGLLEAFDSSVTGTASSLTAGMGATDIGFLFNTTFLVEVVVAATAGVFLR